MTKGTVYPVEDLYKKQEDGRSPLPHNNRGSVGAAVKKISVNEIERYSPKGFVGEILSKELIQEALAVAKKFDRVHGSGEGAFIMIDTSAEEARKERRSKKYIAFRSNVFKRDGYKCTKCGSTKKIHAHHIVPFFLLFDEEKYDVLNATTLCRLCHRKEHKTGWKEEKYRRGIEALSLLTVEVV